LLYNVLAFYELYRDKNLENVENKKSENILDKWIIARLHELTENTTKQLDSYKLLEPVRAIREFIDDLSTWYLRRSRERIKSGDENAKQTLYYVLKTLTKLMAPFTPFASEDIWQKLKNKNDAESVHLAEWPTEGHILKIFSLFEKNGEVIEEMKEVRDIVTLGLQARQDAGIPVRQPLNKIDLPESLLKYTDIVKEELNLKNIVIVDTYIVEADAKVFKVNLDIEITEDLKKEGQYRELIRAIQDIRKKNGLNPNDVITLTIGTDAVGQELINKFKSELMKAVIAKEILFKENEGTEIKIGEILFKVNVLK
jgi:isoleucyl-tRNA synthetase